MEYLGSISKFYENRTKFFFFFSFIHWFSHKKKTILRKDQRSFQPTSRYGSKVWSKDIHSSVRGNRSIFSGPFSSSIYDLPIFVALDTEAVGTMGSLERIALIFLRYRWVPRCHPSKIHVEARDISSMT